ncbi:hypothetical protein INH39_16935 [Massilia violaceinigra]|uniref:Uncharacterized protein n=1 Tax=Massilia violaceinigra TaxID=2045208 RepID=A0ABY3ZXT6_9BURK|nr:hypothetical protein [Massilia violaceinigra]UOD27223.1 hypothetical protein INH39_16935 [Massilia violaceinigra]
MNNTQMGNDKLSLAERREALIVQCSMQRRDAAREIGALMTPLTHPSGAIGKLLGGGGGGMKLPLGIVGTVAGLVMAKSGKILPMLTVGLSLVKAARSVMGLVRKKHG